MTNPKYRRLSCNHNFFDEIDNQLKAYWLGFLAADGQIAPAQASQSAELSLTLSYKDIDHVGRLSQALGSAHKVQVYSVKDKPYARIAIRSNELAEGLAKYGVTPRKTWTLRWPELPEEAYKHFLRGYNDGDGGFYTYVQKNGWRHHSFRLTSNEEFLLGAQKYLMENCALGQTKLYKRTGKWEGTVPTLVYSGGKQVARIFSHLYENASIYLPRKREAIEPYLRLS